MGIRIYGFRGGNIVYSFEIFFQPIFLILRFLSIPLLKKDRSYLLFTFTSGMVILHIRKPRENRFFLNVINRFPVWEFELYLEWRVVHENWLGLLESK